MKKFLIYFFAFVFICFILPAILTKQEKMTTADIKQETTDETKEKPQYDYARFGIIKLLHKETGEIEELSIDDYIYNVVSAEMPASYEIEALKAQAIVARTYTIFKAQNPRHEGADICDDSNCCQAWISKEDRLARWKENEKEGNWAKIEQCVDETKGKIITYNNKPINAFFHANSGGTTEIPVNVWGGLDFPYLQVVETAGEEGYTQYSSEVVLTKEELLNKIQEKYQDIQIDFENEEDIKILEYTDSSRVKTVKFGNHELSGVETRTLLGLKSTNFKIEKQDENIKFEVIGYGHGVGMSQTGADAMAKQGSNYEEIIKHFYTGVEIKEINSL